MNLRKGLLAVGLLFAVPAIAIAAGNYLTYPQVGEPSFCASSNPNGTGVGGTTGQQGSPVNCVQTVPAGPPALTGSELVPADTGVSGPTQTVTIPIVLFGAGDYTYNLLPSTAPAVQVIPNNTNYYLLDSTATVTSLTLTMPSSPLVGQVLRVSSTHTVNNLLVNGATNQTISNAPTALTVSTTGDFGYGFIWTAAPLGWLRVQ